MLGYIVVFDNGRLIVASLFFSSAMSGSLWFEVSGFFLRRDLDGV